MNNRNRNQWLVRGGAFLLVTGFFLPFVSVSCVGVPAGPLSLSEIADYFNQPLLHFALLAFLVLGGLSFIPPGVLPNRDIILYGQLGSLGTSLLFLVLSLANLSGNTGMGIQVSPNIGTPVIIAGYALSFWGMLAQHPAQAQQVRRAIDQIPRQITRPIQPPAVTGPRLERARDPAGGMVRLTHDHFSVGRAVNNDLVIQDASLSPQHAVFRFSNGAWFLQARHSSNQLMVNGRRVQAMRLNQGDYIQMGGSVWVFRLE